MQNIDFKVWKKKTPFKSLSSLFYGIEPENNTNLPIVSSEFSHLTGRPVSLNEMQINYKNGNIKII